MQRLCFLIRGYPKIIFKQKFRGVRLKLSENYFQAKISRWPSGKRLSEITSDVAIATLRMILNSVAQPDEVHQNLQPEIILR